MGGAKKRSLSKIEKQQRLRAQRRGGQQRRATKTKTFEKKVGGIDLPSVSDKDLSNELTKMRTVTPYALAMKYNIKLSIAKDWLDILEEKGMIQRIASSGSLRIYKFWGKA